MTQKAETVAVLGLGYVGLPLAVAFGKRYPTLGFDTNATRVAECGSGSDSTRQVDKRDFAAATQLNFTSDARDLSDAEFIIVAVPTPINPARRPDFGPLKHACSLIGSVMQKGVTVVFESTVFPGATQEICVPVLERRSRLTWMQDFYVAYSPERVNPGDETHTLDTITKLVAGDTKETLRRVADLYRAIISADVYEVESIAIAEAAKVIENTQRDLNIALVNELALIFHRLGLDTTKILDAANTKWNFLPFRPGLVGGHCIGVDPYYLTHKAEMVGYRPEVILAGRRINDEMGKFVAVETVKEMILNGVSVDGATVSVLGVTFKEDCSDLRNTQVRPLVEELRSYGLQVILHDPIADSEDVEREFGQALTAWEELKPASALVV
ncbi:MAG: nucleotide sugar dehydrogenase, partial [Gammaproteobacteria bacterium]|nr:nucleotide sugar dehydrogenase [Gammaproteobacteria bacterium]